MSTKRTSLILFMSIVCFCNINAQKITISGKVLDQDTGENLIGAVVGNNEGTVISNVGGFYSLSLHAGHHVIDCGYIGYSSGMIDVTLTRDTVINIALKPDREAINAAKITSFKRDPFDGYYGGEIDLPVKVVSQTPTFLGESDVMKTLQLLPGIQSGFSGFSGLYVRGGGPDENLLLLDGLPLYNAEHILGLFSVFMPESIKKVTFYKSGFPSRFGGRLSSVLDIRTNDGNNDVISGEVSVNVLSSKIHIEGPVGRKTTTFSFSGRMMNTIFADPIIRNISGKDKGNYWFYDIDGKITHRLSERDKVALNVYNGRDHLYVFTENDNILEEEYWPTKTTSNIDWGNLQICGSWEHVHGSRMYSILKMGYNNYHMRTAIQEDIPPARTEDNLRILSSIDYRSGMKDISASLDFDYHPSNAHIVRWGMEGIWHRFSPEVLGADMKSWEIGGKQVSDTSITSAENQIIDAVECSAYLEDEISLGKALTFFPGFRINMFNVRGRTYLSPEPRFSARYAFNDGLALKAGYSRMSQNIHLLCSTQLTLPMDLWVPATDTCSPMTSNQFSIGGSFGGLTGWAFSLELYYKSSKNILEYKDGAPIMGNTANWEDKVDIGIGRSYGTEMLVRKTSGKLTGWLAYSLSKTERRFPDGSINRGEWFPFKYDRRHNINCFTNYCFSKTLEASATWTFVTGGVTTIPSRQTSIIDPDGNKLEQVNVTYSRGNYRMPPSHYLNVGLNWYRQKTRGQSTWTLSIYNVYNRMNSDLILADLTANRRESSPYVATYRVRSITIIPIMPSIGYSFKF